MLLEEFKVCKIKKIYCDFDGTITQKDVVNAFYEEYAERYRIIKQQQKIARQEQIPSIEKYRLQLDYAIEKWDMDYFNAMDAKINPNSMQRKALRELRRYRDTGVKKALIISATGSGKTYLAAFDARNFGAKRLLYIVYLFLT